MGILIPILLLISAYLLGSIPWALIISKTFKGIDIREYGSKNMGATNVNRVLGFKFGILVFILDALKAGFIVFLFSVGLFTYDATWMVIKIHPLFYGLVAIIGHMFPIFASFKGGKGVSCFAGILLCYSPILFLICFVIFILILLWKKYISLASMITSAIALVLTFFFKDKNGNLDIVFIVVIGLATLGLFISHIPNIKRLFKGTETKFTLKKNMPDSNDTR